MEFIYTVNVDSDEPIMLINKHIGFDDEDGYGIMGDQFQKELIALDGMRKKRIQVWINSPGGIVADGYDIYNACLHTKTKVDTYVTGMACSIAAVIFQAGRTRIMNDYGILMFHNPYSVDGKSNALTDIMKDSINKMIEARCNMTEAQVQAMMDRTTFMDAAEALRMSLCDEIQGSDEANKKRLSAFAGETKAYWKEANTILNKLFNTKNDMKKIADKLGLIPDAAEENIVNAISAMMNKLNETQILNKKKDEDIAAKEQKLKEVEDALEKAKKACDALTEEYNKLKADMEEVDKLKNELEEKSKLEKAQNLVKDLAPGRIKNDAATIAKWVGMAKADFEGTKALLEGIALNKVANRVETTVTGEEGAQQPGYTAIGVMAKINAEIANRKK